MALSIEKGLAIHEAEIVSSYLDGKDDGLAESLANVAKSMLSEGEPVEKIIKHTGLSTAQINALMPKS